MISVTSSTPSQKFETASQTGCSSLPANKFALTYLLIHFFYRAALIGNVEVFIPVMLGKQAAARAGKKRWASNQVSQTYSDENSRGAKCDVANKQLGTLRFSVGQIFCLGYWYMVVLSPIGKI